MGIKVENTRVITLKYEDTETGDKTTTVLSQLGMTRDEFLNEHIKAFMTTCGWIMDWREEILIDREDWSEDREDQDVSG